MGKLIGGLVGLVALAIAFLFFGSWYTVDQGERAVLLTNGAISSVEGPGLHFKTPWFQSAKKLSTRQQVYHFGFDDGEQPVLQAYSKDQQAADIRVTVNYRVPEAEVAKVYQEYGTVEALASRTIGREVPQELKVVFGRYDAVTVIQDRAKFNADVFDTVTKSIKGPIFVDSIQIENIDFSDAYEQAIEARMTAQVEVQKRQQQLATEEINAKIAVTQAQGKANSTKAQAEAEAFQVRIRGEAEAEAIRARASALGANPGLVELTKAERWDGKLPTTVLPNSAVPFIEAAK